MTTIEQYLIEIAEATYGEEVRGAIINAIKQCYVDSTTGISIGGQFFSNSVPAPYNNLNTVPVNKIVTYASGSLSAVANRPGNFSSGFTMFSFNGNSENNSGSGQIAVGLLSGELAYRSATGAAGAEDWTPWTYSNSIKLLGRYQYPTQTPPFNDLNNQPVNSIITITSSPLKNAPVNSPGISMVLNGVNGYSGCVQQYFPLIGTKMYYRIALGSDTTPDWQPWNTWPSGGGGTGSTIVIAKDGSGDFTTFREGTEYCWTHPNTTVYVKGGVYDLTSEYPESYTDAIVYGYPRNHSIGPECGYNCNYIFQGAMLLFDYDGKNPYAVEFFSPINIVGECTFENMIIECSNCRYCVHDDPLTVTSPAPTSYIVSFNNCRMWHKGNTAGSYRDTCCIGGGTNAFSISNIDGGTYIAGTNSWAAISYHLPSTGAGTKSYVNIKNVYSDGKLLTHNYGDATGTLYLTVQNSSSNYPISYGSKTNAIAYLNELRS